MIPFTLEQAFGGITSAFTAMLWYWVRGIDSRLKQAESERAALQKELHDVKLMYATKAEARADRDTIMSSLTRLENKMDKMADKLDRKADKS
ncbi:hypothetical protein [Neisseria perflava]|uniref:hypothetical protein n=1 Tax=Neisseria perflava TaxID=33053 RepID=UPI0020A1AC6F|nr:hypothetical protein [Neisseria perflava]MCP1659326.1 CRISPR/Cas system-associated exonuclease Cas4 (RecB family) [Neisseria perflava]MCP1772869.1 CRISPR/Cas system-associated exonuclease Cas4 (RecB family) [Neisseria perflava]